MSDNISPNTVSLFIPCLMDQMTPEAAKATMNLLTRLGMSVHYPREQTCCGQPAFNAGRLPETRIAAKRFIRIFGPSRWVVSPSGSCVHMVRHHYPELFRADRKWLPRAMALARRTFELTEFIVDVLGVTGAKSTFTGKVTYHASCHLARGLNVRRQPLMLLENVAEIQFLPMADADHCCGFGGMFAVKYPEISEAILEKKIRRILETGADTVVGCDMGCLLNIQGRLSRIRAPVKTLHIAQVLV